MFSLNAVTHPTFSKQIGPSLKCKKGTPSQSQPWQPNVEFRGMQPQAPSPQQKKSINLEVSVPSLRVLCVCVLSLEDYGHVLDF